MEYDMPLYRPPSEGRSLIFQVTLGCSWNKCLFCGMYKGKRFKVRPWEDLRKDIIEMSGISLIPGRCSWPTGTLSPWKRIT